MKNLFFVLLFVFLGTIGTLNAQIFTHQEVKYIRSLEDLNKNQSISKIWLEICKLNRKAFPDSNKVRPNDLILLPLNRYYSAKENNKDHFWKAVEYFYTEIIHPNLLKPVVVTGPIEEKKVENSGENYFFIHRDYQPFAILGAVILFVLALFLFSLIKERKERNRFPFIPLEKHSFSNSTNRDVVNSAKSVVRNLYGLGVKIKGDIERGMANGKLLMLHKNGEKTKHFFNNEPAFRAIVQFPNGKEKQVVCRWTCFNPLIGTLDAEFSGTFTPENIDSKMKENIPSVSEEEIRVTQQNITSLENQRIIEGISFIEVKKPPKTVSCVRKNSTINFSKIQISKDKGLTLEASEGVEIKISDLEKLIQIYGEDRNHH